MRRDLHDVQKVKRFDGVGIQGELANGLHSICREPTIIVEVIQKESYDGIVDVYRSLPPTSLTEEAARFRREGSDNASSPLILEQRLGFDAVI